MMKFKKIILGLFTISAIVCFASCKTDNIDPKPGEHEALEYTVTFDSMDGSKVDSQTVIRGTKATEPTAPTRAGYEFKGWYKDSSGTYRWDFDEDVVTGNVTLYAKWEDKQVTPVKEYWTVTIDLNDGSTPKTQQVEKGQKLTGVEEPTREGYEFTGWKANDAAWTMDSAITADITIVAQWTEKTVTPVKEYWTVTIDLNDGTDATTKQVEKGQKLTGVEEPTREGYEFTGWKANDAAWTMDTAITADITIVAQWNEKTVTPVKEYWIVTIDLNDGTEPTTQQVEKGQKLTGVAEPTREGYEFTGWKANDAAWTMDEAITANITIVAQWEEVIEDTFNISYESEYGILPAPYNGVKLEDTLPVLTDNTYVFEGWYLTPDFDETKKAVAGAEISEDTVLYAKWRSKTWYDILIEEPEFVLVNNDFNSFAGTDKLPEYDNTWDGVAGLYEGTGKSSSSKVDPSPTTTFIRLGNGNAELVDSSDGASVNLMARFGNITSGIVEGYFEATLSSQGNSWTFFQLNGTNATKTSTSEIFGIRIDSGLLKFRRNGGSAETAETSITASDSKYDVYFMVDLQEGTITVTVNDKPFVTNLNLGFTSVAGFKLTSSDGGSKTMSIDNVAVKNLNVSLDEYKALAKQNAIDYLAGLNVSDEVKASCQSVLDSAKTSIDSKTTFAQVKEAYNKFVSDIEVQILSAQKADMIDELNSYVDKNLYTYENLNKKDLNSAISAGIANINAATSYNAAVNALAAAKRIIDAIPTDAEQLDFYKKSAVSELKVFKDAANYIINATQFADTLNAGVTAINAATTIELVDSALNTAKDNLSKVKTDTEELVAKKAELVALLNEKANELNAELTGDKYIALINAELQVGIANINAATSIVDAEKERTDSANRMDAIFTASISTIQEYKEFAIAELAKYALEASAGYEDATLLSDIETALNNGITAINNAAALDLSEPDVKDAITTALNDAKAAIDECIDDFENGVSEEIIKQGQVEVSDFGGNSETMFMEWKSLSGATDYQVLLKGGAYTDYTLVDEKICYVQSISGGYRADLLGLEAGVYNAKVVPIISGTPNENASTIVRANVIAYDRSGYAHFNYTEGVGAYDDKGVLKNNAIVLYVTDENKNTVELTYGGKTVRGIGNILNSVGQECGEAGHEGQCRRVSDGKVYYGKANTNAGILKDLAEAHIPLVVRFIGCVSNTGFYETKTFNASSTPLIDGLTFYDCYDNGGSEKDNGHMARMQSAKDVTLEGIGSNATIDGWGFHFMCQTSDPNLAKNFEVRNLIFINTPEDAIGMEGQQEGGKITASVERCWIHHNEFYGPHISSPAESDKSEGDGSCDFKRGQYLTVSYNYFEGCHKTNLVGSADSSLQFNLTYHHNYWRFCKARGPLTRQANVHMYNNVFEGQTDYAMNPRANSYIYSEYNLFFMCKNPHQIKLGAIKSFNDSFSSCIGSMDGTIVSNKSQIVANSCKYGSIDYSKFDTDSTQSYIPSGNYLLHDNITEVRKVVYAQAGVQKPHRIDPENVTLEDVSYLPSGVTPTVVSSFPSELTPGKISKTVYAFTIDKMATVTVSASDESVLLNLAGECFISGDGSAVLEPGTYIVQGMNFQPGDATKLGTFKDLTISSIHFEEYNSAEYDAKVIEDFKAKVARIPATITYTENCYQTIKSALTAYNALRSELKEQVSTDYAKAVQANKDYIAAGKDRVETLISNIGIVSINSGAAITNARNAYNDLMTKDATVKISNYATLEAAETAFRSFAVESCINKINAISNPVTLADGEAIRLARDEYDLLDDDQQLKITNYNKLVEAERVYEQLEATDVINGLIDDADLSDFESLEQVMKAYDELEDKSNIIDTAKLSQIRVQYTIMLINQIGTVTTSSKEAIDKADTKYTALSEAEKQLVSNYNVLTEAKAAFQELASQGYNMIYESIVDENGFFTTSGTIEDLSSPVTYNGETYTKGLSMQGSGPTISFTPTQSGKITMIMMAGNKFKLNGTNTNTATQVSDVYILEFDVVADTTYTIIRNSGRGAIISISFTPTTTE